MKRMLAVLVIAVMGAAAGAAVALFVKKNPELPQPTTALFSIEALEADAKSTPPWNQLRSLSWYQTGRILSAFDGKRIQTLEASLLSLLEDETLPITTRYTVSYLIQHVSQKKAIDAVSDPAKVNVGAMRSWQQARGFQYRMMIDSDYTSAIMHLKATLVMMSTMPRPQAIAALRDAGWEILGEDEAALRALN